MVTRKPLLPYPNSPPPPPPPAEFAPYQPHHDLDSADIPPVTQIKRTPTEDSPYHDMGNPWQDQSTTKSSDKPSTPMSAPTTSHVENGSLNTAHPSHQQLPDILKPGWSGENTPRSSIDSDRSKDFWEESSDDESRKKQKNEREKKAKTEESKSPDLSEIPSILQVKRKPVSPKVTQDHGKPEYELGFASNNPFRLQQEPGNTAIEDTRTHDQINDAKGKASQSGTGLVDWESVQLPKDTPATISSPFSTAEPTTSFWNLDSETPPPPPQNQPPPVPGQAPPISVLPPSPFSSQPPLIAVDTEQNEVINPWKSSPQTLSRQNSPLPEQKAVYNNDLIDRGSKGGHQGGLVSLGDEIKALPNHGPTTLSQDSLLSLDTGSKTSDKYKGQVPVSEFAPPPGPPPSQTAPPPLVQQSSSIKPLTQAEIAAMNEQRNEKYQVKHFRWFDHRMRKLRSSSMLTQNKNGPCPLLALVNALILGAQDQDQAALDEFLRTREQVTLGTIIENLMMELLATAEDGELPDVDELNRFLLKLRTGMNMNPRFVSKAQPAPNLMDARNSMLHIPEVIQTVDQPGTFERSQDIRLYGAFGVQTVHGWLPKPDSDAAAAFKRTAQNYEDAQAKLFGEDELEYKLTRTGLSPEEQVIWEDIVSMKHFFQSNPTQLSQYGLHCIKASMKPGSFSVLFRNDHFSTIYLHPQDGQLYSLITDAGYADRDEIIWESLVDTSGHNTEFFSGDFKSVSHTANQSAEVLARRHSGQREGQSDSQDNIAPLSPVQKQEQEDADFAMAMQLQEEEEQRDRQRRAQETSSSNAPQSNRTTGRRSTGNIPIPIRGNTSGNNLIPQEARPYVPPRGIRSSAPAVNRSAETVDPDAPPAYEEAARSTAYHPPLGSPLHPASSTDGGSVFGSTSNLNLTEANSNTSRPGRNRRRSSAYVENAEQYGRPSPAYDFTDGRMPGSYIHTGRGGHGQSANLGLNPTLGLQSQRQRDRDRDCVVM